MLINIDKSYCLHSTSNNGASYGCNNGHIPHVEFFKDLGIVQSADSGYKQQINYVTNKAKHIFASVLNNIIIPNPEIGWNIF